MKLFDRSLINNTPLLRTLLYHTLAWMALFLFIRIYAARGSVSYEFSLLSLVPNIITVIQFYINYNFLVDKFIFKNKFVEFAICNIVLFILFYLLLLWLEPLMGGYTYGNIIKPFRYTLIGQIFLGIIIVAPAIAIRMISRWRDIQRRYVESETVRLEMELDALKNQLNPHFLFNSLNNIYALISFNPKVARKSLMSVCSLLRYQLYDSDYRVVELEKEVTFIKDYCDLMRLRLDDDVAISVELPESTLGIKIAPLLFISLVENAFKHGVDSVNGSYIDIRMSIVGDVIHFVCRNSNYPKTTEDRSGSGIGVLNLQRRLELIYPQSHNYDAKVVGDDYIVTLIINTLEND